MCHTVDKSRAYNRHKHITIVTCMVLNVLYKTSDIFTQTGAHIISSHMLSKPNAKQAFKL